MDIKCQGHGDTKYCTTPRREHTSKALGYDRCSQGISQFYLHTPAFVR